MLTIASLFSFEDSRCALYTNKSKSEIEKFLKLSGRLSLLLMFMFDEEFLSSVKSSLAMIELVSG